ncbi:MAG: hypothetical protein ACETVN_02735 [Asgard group archaeon]
MRGFRDDFKDFHYLKNRGAILNHRKRSKKITLTVLVLLLTVSIVLAVPETLTKTKTTPQKPAKAIMVEKGTNSNNDEATNEWDKSYGGNDGDGGTWVEQTSDRGYIIAGSTRSFGAGFSDVWLIKTDENGTVLWSKTYGGTYYDWGTCVRQTADGGYIITGSTEYNGTSGDIWLIKTDTNGDEEWNQTYGGPIDDYGRCVMQTSDGGYIITGYQGQFYAKSIFTISLRNSASGGIWLIKTNSTGGLEWNKTYGRAYVDKGYCVEQVTDGGYIIVGSTIIDDSDTSYDVWLIKTDENGNEVWDKTFGEKGSDEGYCVQQTVDGGYIITGKKAPHAFCYNNAWLTKNDKNHDNIHNIKQIVIYIPYDVWLIKTDPNGNGEWSKIFGGLDDDTGYSVSQTTDGGYIIAGYTNSFGAGHYDVWLIKTDLKGNKQWSKTYGGTWDDIGCCVLQTSDGGYIILGSTESYGAGYRDVWLIKTYGVEIDHNIGIYIIIGIVVIFFVLAVIYLNRKGKLSQKEL